MPPVFVEGARPGDEGRGRDRTDPPRAFVRGKTIKEIVRELHVSWNTLPKPGSGVTTWAR
jgi:hypothetical protein